MAKEGDKLYLCKHYLDRGVICSGKPCMEPCELTHDPEKALYPLPVAFSMPGLEYWSENKETGEREFTFGSVDGCITISESEIWRKEDG